MNNVVVTDVPRAAGDKIDELAAFGVATVHEALGRVGYVGTEHRPLHRGSRIGGSAVTALCWPGDNMMIHAAVEQCRPGDILVVTTASPSTDGMFGELLATSLCQRGVRGLVTTGAVRDVAELNAMGFPVFCAAVSAQGTVKATPGAVNIPHRTMTAERMAQYPKDTAFVVYCAGPHCNGANKGAVRLARLGYRVKEMIGGVTGWQDENFALVRETQSAAA